MSGNCKPALAPRILAVAVAVVLFCSMVYSVAGEEDTFQSVIVRITALSNLKLLEDAIIALDAGGEAADAIKESPQQFLQDSGLSTGEGDLVLLVNTDTNEALTPFPGVLGAVPEGFALSNVAFVFAGERRGIIVQRKVPSDAPPQPFEEAATELTLWSGDSLEYLAKVVHWVNGLDEADDESRDQLDFFFLAPVEYIVERAVEEKQLGIAITFPFLEAAHIIAFDTGRITDPDAGRFVPAEPFALSEEVVIGIGYVSMDWAIFVELTTFSDF